MEGMPITSAEWIYFQAEQGYHHHVHHCAFKMKDNLPFPFHSLTSTFYNLCVGGHKKEEHTEKEISSI